MLTSPATEHEAIRRLRASVTGDDPTLEFGDHSPFDDIKVLLAEYDRLCVAQGHAQPVQDTYLVGGPPDLKAMSGSTEDDRIIQLHFRRPATEDDRKWLLDAINAALGFPAQQHNTVISREAFDKFIETCENPPAPTEELKAMFREFGRFAAPAQSTSVAQLTQQLIHQADKIAEMDDELQRLRAQTPAQEDARPKLKELLRLFKDDFLSDDETIEGIFQEVGAIAQRHAPTENAIHNAIANALAGGTTYSNVRHAARDVLALIPVASTDRTAKEPAWDDLLCNLKDLINAGRAAEATSNSIACMIINKLLAKRLLPPPSTDSKAKSVEMWNSRTVAPAHGQSVDKSGGGA
jgi:hypothetical protein